ncbi:LuxR C-terminal-related transcriptional regulator [Streptomyces cellulosae]|uniref:LuxR C-terminal-related transcriptional regulator n=1 Tax=Streptomyces cellulosae TaxID=1968 RepID=UPI000AAFAD45|nr:LuxR C-terminal-related transcriptional regulator [Streptomyces cellulosae]
MRCPSLTPGLDLTAYRVVQEALTNITKHVATRTAQVRIACTPHYLTLTITNEIAPDRRWPPPAPDADSVGSACVSALSRGGTFSAGRRPQGGFEVACSLPLHSPDDFLALPELLGALTEREREVMALAAHGKSNAEIADELVLSPLTIRSHIQRAMTKLHARDRAQLVVIAYESGLVTPHQR